MRFNLYSGADNRFLLIEQAGAPGDWSKVAREVCRQRTFGEQSADGLLVVEHAPQGWRMTVYNADGSRPEACGNGLRCVGWHLARGGHGQVSRIATDAGQRRVEVLQQRSNGAELVAEMGRARVHSLGASLPAVEGLIEALGVQVGNPHCILRVEDERRVDVESLGRAIQTDPEFPAGVNVGFIARRGKAWYLRVWERGVGETAACGTGACAAAVVVAPPSAEVVIHMRGGALRVRRDANAGLELFGEAQHVGECELHVESAFEEPSPTN